MAQTFMLSVPVAHPGTDGMGASEEGLGQSHSPDMGVQGQSPRWRGLGRSRPQKLKPKNTLAASRKAFWLRFMRLSSNDNSFRVLFDKIASVYFI